MKRFSTNANEDSGFTLLELLVTVAVLAVILTGLCEAFMANQRAWKRQSGASSALLATDAALSSLGSYASNAMDAQVYTRFSGNDVLAICLPADIAHGAYVPTTSVGWDYRRGQCVVFYLSDSTGSYLRSGDILWAGTMLGWGTPSSANVTPDSTWSLYPGTTVGRVAPIGSVTFGLTSGPSVKNVCMTVVASYKAGSTTAILRRTRNICLRSQLY